MVLQEGKACCGCLVLVCNSVHKHLGHRARTVSFLLIGLIHFFNVLIAYYFIYFVTEIFLTGIVSHQNCIENCVSSPYVLLVLDNILIE